MAPFIKYQGTARVVKKPTDTGIESKLLPKVGVRVAQSSRKDAQYNTNALANSAQASIPSGNYRADESGFFFLFCEVSLVSSFSLPCLHAWDVLIHSDRSSLPVST